ncbi:hypothetical protein CKO08_12270 [Halorhodospira halochloris]|nr:hypothetical protein [Halorhodospira halochloris]
MISPDTLRDLSERFGGSLGVFAVALMSSNLVIVDTIGLPWFEGESLIDLLVRSLLLSLFVVAMTAFLIGPPRSSLVPVILSSAFVLSVVSIVTGFICYWFGWSPAAYVFICSTAAPALGKLLWLGAMKWGEGSQRNE